MAPRSKKAAAVQEEEEDLDALWGGGRALKR